MLADPNQKAGRPPFDASRLDDLMEKSGIDVIVATSRHNVQYLLGGYRFFFFETIDAAGINRYLPVVIYWKGHPDRTAYVGNLMEGPEKERGSFWNADNFIGSWDSTQAMAAAITHLKNSGLPTRSIGIEASFLPADAKDALAAAFSDSAIVDAHRPLELLRAVKKPYEVDLIRRATEGVAESAIATFAETRVGTTKREMIAMVRREQFARGVDFNFCQATIGSNLDRTPTSQVLAEGEVVSLDCVGNVNGYVGDICRMGVVGEPDAELQDILAVIQQVQAVVRQKIRVGVMGGDLIAAGDAAVKASAYGSVIDFTVHGLGLVSHESPRLAYGRPLPYPASDADLPIETGMVLSVETAVRHPRSGFIKLEDTMITTEGGSYPLGDVGRDWNRIAGG
jgi:Xaa-Pro aminopeptidase